jgi:3-oxoacid CoA-transferase subunit A
MHFYITGDTHGDFSRIENFCSEQETTVDDVMIILGDAGINYFLNSRDEMLKSRLAELEITLFCIHGNHEARPWEAGDYDEVLWNGGIVYVEAEYPNILFAKDGEIYDFNGKKVIAIGGAYSVDKGYRLATGMRWYETEQPDDEIKAYVEAQLKKADWRVDIVLTHAAPIEAEPVWAFLPGTDQSRVNKDTEKWLQYICDNLSFEQWYCGHYHVEWEDGNIRFMFEEYDEII